MAGRSENLAHDLKAWAADQLHVGPDCAPAQIRAAFLRRVHLDNGALNLAAREALLILTGRNAARPALALEAAEEKLQLEVDDFATRFFSLAIAERRDEWTRLRARGQGFVRVDARLAALRVGLDVILPSFQRDTPAQHLVSIVGELFVLRPAARSARRKVVLDEVKPSGQLNAWARAAVLLRTTYSAAALEPELLAALAESTERVDDKRQLNRTMRKAVDPAPAGRPNKSWLWVIVVIAGFASKMFLSLDRTPPGPNPNVAPVPEFNAPRNFDAKDLLKNLKFKKAKDGQGWELEAVDPAEAPKDKRELP